MKTRWFVWGDVNGFFGLMFDNVTVLSFLAGILIFAFGMPADVVYRRMFPGTALGVFFGDLCYTWMATRLRRQTGNPDTCAMPLGLDTPSTIGLALTVLGPCFLTMKSKGLTEHEAAMMTWYVGMAVMVMVGIFKLGLSFFGGWVQRIVPQAGLLGSLAGIGLALIGFMPLLDIFGQPLVGMISLGIILFNLVAHRQFPRNAPGVLVAVVVGTLLYYLLAPTGFLGTSFAWPKTELHFGAPVPTLSFLKGLGQAWHYLPIALPFGILTVVGGINVTESARVAGDDYRTRDILLVEALATLAAGLTGGVAQTTPYIGQPAFKAMGARLGYTILTGVFVGLGGMLGYISFIVELIPRAVLAPILIFVALDIMAQAFIACPAKHAPAVSFAYFPTVARLLQIKLSNPEVVAPAAFLRLLHSTGKSLSELQVLVALGNGFILTAMLWGGMMACLIDHKFRSCSVYLLILAALSFFGIIHSAMPDGNMYWPWTLSLPARLIPCQFSLSYLVLGLFLALIQVAAKKDHQSG